MLVILFFSLFIIVYFPCHRGQKGYFGCKVKQKKLKVVYFIYFFSKKNEKTKNEALE